ncbi:MAG: aldose 1-epimerase family protein, partial [Clostridia bacterium]|nr:aldose 1-epimerase family protein [Clostridia bacterium]
ICFRDGMADGIKAIELQNRSGLYLSCIEDQCLNIYDFSYKGINCAFQTKNGLVSNRFFNGGVDEFSYYWPAGMLYTCGLANVGEPVVENGVFHPQHGRIGMTSAKNVSINYTDDEIIVKGIVNDTIFCAHNLELSREIIFPKDGKEITIRDTISNLEPVCAEFMFMYHCNFGYPVLAPGARMVKGKGEIVDVLGSAKHPEECGAVTAPQVAKDEEVYLHTNTPDADGFGYAAVINDELKLGCYLKYKMDALPYLVQWKNFCAHDYGMGLEPSNCYILGREKERAHGTLPKLSSYETKKYQISIGILDGEEEIARFEKKLGTKK